MEKRRPLPRRQVVKVHPPPKRPEWDDAPFGGCAYDYPVGGPLSKKFKRGSWTQKGADLVAPRRSASG